MRPGQAAAVAAAPGSAGRAERVRRRRSRPPGRGRRRPAPAGRGDPRPRPPRGVRWPPAGPRPGGPPGAAANGSRSTAPSAARDHERVEGAGAGETSAGAAVIRPAVGTTAQAFHRPSTRDAVTQPPPVRPTRSMRPGSEDAAAGAALEPGAFVHLVPLPPGAAGEGPPVEQSVGAEGEHVDGARPGGDHGRVADDVYTGQPLPDAVAAGRRVPRHVPDVLVGAAGEDEGDAGDGDRLRAAGQGDTGRRHVVQGRPVRQGGRGAHAALRRRRAGGGGGRGAAWRRRGRRRRARWTAAVAAGGHRRSRRSPAATTAAAAAAASLIRRSPRRHRPGPGLARGRSVSRRRERRSIPGSPAAA